MQEIQASEAKTHLPRLLDQVERGETIIITRHGKPIARLVPDHDEQRRSVAQVMKEIEEFRKKMPRLTEEEIISSIHEGHKY